jgi:hypothetical protein
MRSLPPPPSVRMNCRRFMHERTDPSRSRAAGLTGLEGMVSKHSCYGCGRYDRWIKVEHRAHPAFSRVLDQF